MSKKPEKNKQKNNRKQLFLFNVCFVNFEAYTQTSLFLHYVQNRRIK